MTHQQVNSAMLVDDFADFAFLLENNFRVMTRISVRFVTYQSGHYNEQITERRNGILLPKLTYCEKKIVLVIEKHF